MCFSNCISDTLRHLAISCTPPLNYLFYYPNAAWYFKESLVTALSLIFVWMMWSLVYCSGGWTLRSQSRSRCEVRICHFLACFPRFIKVSIFVPSNCRLLSTFLQIPLPCSLIANAMHLVPLLHIYCLFLLAQLFGHSCSAPLSPYPHHSNISSGDRLCGLVVRVPGYTTEMYCVSCEVRTEFIYVM
jgi:hypothetical protein